MQPSQMPLKDIHLPEAIGWWPPAIGWWLLAVLIPLLIVALVLCYKRLSRKTAIKAAKKILAGIKQDSSKDNARKLCELSMLLRRVAISTSPKAGVAGLTGREWLAFLDSSVKGSPFSEGIGACLADAPYRQSAPSDDEIARLVGLCEDWLKSRTRLKPTQAAKPAREKQTR